MEDPSVLFFQQKLLSVEHWTPPAHNVIKINVDGAVFERWNCFSVGFIARDALGQPIALSSHRFFGIVQPSLVEIMGIKEALSWISHFPWTSIVLESDSALCVQALLG